MPISWIGRFRVRDRMGGPPMSTFDLDILSVVVPIEDVKGTLMSMIFKNLPSLEIQGSMVFDKVITTSFLCY